MENKIGTPSFRHTLDSHSHNKNQQEWMEQISFLYERANQLQQEVRDHTRVFDAVNQFQHQHTTILENRVRQLEEEVNQLKKNSGEKTIRLYSENMRADESAGGSEQAFIDSTYHVLHLPISGNSVSKVHIKDPVDGSTYVPSSLQARVLPESKPGWRIHENDIKSAFLGDNRQYWHRIVTLPMEDAVPDGIVSTVHVTLPDTMIGNRKVNTVTLRPFPSHSAHIERVEYRLEGEWKLLPGWEVDDEKNPISIEYAGPLKFCFPTTDMAEVRIVIRQHQWLEENHLKAYHFGFQEIGITHTEYQSDYGRFEIPVILSDTTETKILKSITPEFQNETALLDRSEDKSSLFDFQIFTLDEFGELQYTKDTFPIMVTSERLVIRANLHKDKATGGTPALRGIKLVYENV
jgi:uncharacterized protein YdcH (DUF465 family)